MVDHACARGKGGGVFCRNSINDFIMTSHSDRSPLNLLWFLTILACKSTLASIVINTETTWYLQLDQQFVSIPLLQQTIVIVLSFL